MRLGLIGDIHYGQNHESTNHPGYVRQNSERALETLRQTIDRFNHASLDYVVQLGDLINPAGHDADAARMRELALEFARLKTPLIFLLGNHDLDNLSKEEMARLVSSADSKLAAYGSRVVDEWQLHWFNHTHRDGVDFIPPKAIEAWQQTIDPNKSQIIFSHYPVVDISVDRSFYFANHPDKAHLSLNPFEHLVHPPDLPAVYVNAHLHFFGYRQEDNMLSITVPPYSDNMQSSQNELHHPETYTIFSISKDQGEIEIFSGDFVLGRLIVPLPRPLK